MKTVRYCLKVTYMDGPHAGTSYYMRKGGYVTNLEQYQDESDTYANLTVALRTCKKLAVNNIRDFDSERSYNEYKKSKGQRYKTNDNQFLYWHEKYEPVQVDMITDQIDPSKVCELVS